MNRKEEVENLTTLLQNISSPIVFSINSPWGTGKTTFSQMLHANLLNQGSKAIYFSAWETDFAPDPLVAFLGEINQELEEIIHGDAKKTEIWNKAKKAGAHILKKGIPAGIKLLTGLAIELPEYEGEVVELVTGFSEDIISEYTKSKGITIPSPKKSGLDRVNPDKRRNFAEELFN